MCEVDPNVCLCECHEDPYGAVFHFAPCCSTCAECFSNRILNFKAHKCPDDRLALSLGLFPLI